MIIYTAWAKIRMEDWSAEMMADILEYEFETRNKLRLVPVPKAMLEAMIYAKASEGDCNKMLYKFAEIILQKT